MKLHPLTTGAVISVLIGGVAAFVLFPGSAGARSVSAATGSRTASTAAVHAAQRAPAHVTSHVVRAVSNRGRGTTGTLYRGATTTNGTRSAVYSTTSLHQYSGTGRWGLRSSIRYGATGTTSGSRTGHSCPGH